MSRILATAFLSSMIACGNKGTPETNAQPNPEPTAAPTPTPDPEVNVTPVRMGLVKSLIGEDTRCSGINSGLTLSTKPFVGGTTNWLDEMTIFSAQSESLEPLRSVKLNF